MGTVWDAWPCFSFGPTVTHEEGVRIPAGQCEAWSESVGFSSRGTTRIQSQVWTLRGGLITTLMPWEPENVTVPRSCHLNPQSGTPPQLAPPIRGNFGEGCTHWQAWSNRQAVYLVIILNIQIFAISISGRTHHSGTLRNSLALWSKPKRIKC